MWIVKAMRFKTWLKVVFVSQRAEFSSRQNWTTLSRVDQLRGWGDRRITAEKVVLMISMYACHILCN